MKLPLEMNDDFKKRFGFRLQDLRKKRSFTQENFAEIMNVSLNTVKKWEQGKAFPEAGHLLIIPVVLDCDLDYLIGRIDRQSHALEASMNYTGLSEKAVQTLHAWNKRLPSRKPMTALSALIEQKEAFFPVIYHAWNYFQERGKTDQKKKKSGNVIVINTGKPSAADMALFMASNSLTSCIKKAGHPSTLNE